MELKQSMEANDSVDDAKKAFSLSDGPKKTLPQ
jgi:hypothetical protein